MKLFKNLVCALTIMFSAQPTLAAVDITKVENIYFVNLTGPIEYDIKQYQPLLEVLYNAKKGESVILNIKSGGGYVSTGKKIIKALNSTKAYTISNVTSIAYSMAAYITCYTDRLAMKPGSEIMFHHGSVVLSGRWTITGLKNLVDESLNETAELNNQCKSKGIITDKDISNMDNGADVYLGANTVNKRLDAKRGKK